MGWSSKWFEVPKWFHPLHPPWFRTGVSLGRKPWDVLPGTSPWWRENCNLQHSFGWLATNGDILWSVNYAGYLRWAVGSPFVTEPLERAMERERPKNSYGVKPYSVMWMHWLMIFCEVAPQGCTSKLQEPKSLEHNDSRCPIEYDGTGLYSDILRHVLAYDIQMQDMQGFRAGLCKHPLKSAGKSQGFHPKAGRFAGLQGMPKGGHPWSARKCGASWAETWPLQNARIGPVASSKLGFQRISLLQTWIKMGLCAIWIKFA